MERFFLLTQNASIDLKREKELSRLKMNLDNNALTKMLMLSDIKIKSFIMGTFQTFEQQVPNFQKFINRCPLCSLKSASQLSDYQGSYFSSEYIIGYVKECRNWVLFNDMDLEKDKVNRLGNMPNSGNVSEE
jgi:hypothetical protein